jgi:glyoxylase-like metal-dependent hydrolase (beta-lactamase superfamily II)/ferredoxin
MARPALRLPTNVEGDLFVDSSCIDCDACRMIAPGTFTRRARQSAVYRQPAGGEELHRALQALVSCPTASIGSATKHDLTAVIASLPAPFAENVEFCGFTAESSFGALSWLIRRPEGNILIDSPRFTLPLARNMTARGGVALMLLTHRDDVADHLKWNRYFAAPRVLHARDVTRGTASVEQQPEGDRPIAIADGLLMIPTPGHTRGHAVFLYRDTFLFTGDHLSWDPERERLEAWPDVCWYSWPEQIRSMERLLDYRFEWVLPGHGRPVNLPPDTMRQQIEQCIEEMKQQRQ